MFAWVLRPESGTQNVLSTNLGLDVTTCARSSGPTVSTYANPYPLRAGPSRCGCTMVASVVFTGRSLGESLR
jgi:hypothetical protein